MILAIVRSLCAVAAGLATALVLIIAVEGVSAVLHPFPPGADPQDMEVCKAHVANYPRAILALAVAAWGLTAFAAPWVATRLGTGRHMAHGLFIGLLLLAAVSFNMSMLPYPWWFWVNVVVFPIASIAGAKLASRSGRPSLAGDNSAIR